MHCTPQASLDYHRVARALRYLDKHQLVQPSLHELAEALGLSPHHTQRLFQRWAGVSPKRFVQYLTREHARVLLRQSHSVADTARQVGLSSSGRLHDLFINTEGVTPGQHSDHGAGLTIAYGYGPTPFGEALLATTDRGLCHLGFVLDGQDGKARALDLLRGRFEAASLIESPVRIRGLAQRVFDAAGQAGEPLSMWLRGTRFQLQVWQALLQIPVGELRNYGQVASAVGRPGAARAVGNAVGANPIAYLIPCHRVLRGTGQFGNYAWGPERKRLVVAWDSSQAGDVS